MVRDYTSDIISNGTLSLGYKHLLNILTYIPLDIYTLSGIIFKERHAMHGLLYNDSLKSPGVTHGSIWICSRELPDRNLLGGKPLGSVEDQ